MPNAYDCCNFCLSASADCEIGLILSVPFGFLYTHSV